MMTRGEAIAILQEKYDYCKSFYDLAARPKEDYAETAQYLQALQVALSALRPVSREQVEKVWRGEWNQDEHGRVVCNRCGSMTAIGTENALHNAKKYDRFCFYCGAPMTDEAVEMVMERLEALKDGN